MTQKISLRVIKRISFYYDALLKLNLSDDTYISSKKLEEITGVSCNQVRQDFFYLGVSIGKQKKGYQVKKLFQELRRILSIDTGADVVVIGAGRLGMALSEYKLFRARNINVRALFDVKPELVGSTTMLRGEEVKIYHVDELCRYLSDNSNVKIAIMAVPEAPAQDIFTNLINCGIQGVVNFAPKTLKLPPHAKHVQLVNECIGAALYKIVYQLHHS